MEKAIQPPPTSAVGVSRRVVYRTRGQARGPLVRMVGASDVGQLIKPFVFLDLVDTQQREIARIGRELRSKGVLRQT